MSRSLWIFMAMSLMAFPGMAAAQQGQPPPCCNLDATMEAPGSQMTVSDEAIRGMGLTRQTFLERTAELFFADGKTDLLVFTSMVIDSATIASAPSLASSGGAAPTADEPPLLVHVSSVYRVPWDRTGEVDLNTIERAWITNGNAYVEVIFQKTSADK